MSITEQDQDPKAAADSAISSAAGKTRKEAAPVKGADGSTGDKEDYPVKKTITGA